MRRGIIALVFFGLTALPIAAQSPQAPQAPQAPLVGDYDSWGKTQQPGAATPALTLASAATEPAPTPPPPGAEIPPYQFTNPNSRIWYTGEYLLWFVRGDPSHFPLVTSDSNPGTATSGSLASATAIVLFGGSGIDYRGFSGTRQALGGWVDEGRTLGVEVSGLALERRTAAFAAGSDNAGNPPLYLPAFNISLGREDSLVIADPILKFAGNVAIDSSLRLWGTEVAGIWNVVRSEGWNLNLVTGFRYLDLTETLLLQAASTDLANGSVTALTDSFQTRNQFYGWQLAARASYTYGPITLRLTAETAIGTTHEVVTIAGSSTMTGAKPFAGGFFAEPSNSGRQTGNTFSAVPKVGGRIDYHLTRWLTVFVGGDLLYWTSVVRAGDQIDRTLNLSQNPILGTTGGTLVGAARPAPLFTRSDFLATGVSCGLQLVY
jgi:hypothetical protein